MRKKVAYRGRKEQDAIVLDHNDPLARAARMARLEAMEDQIFARATGLVDAVLSFSEVTHDQAEPPADWVIEYGAEGAAQRLRVAKTGWMPNSQSPSGTLLASRVVTGIAKARGRNGTPGGNNLNVVISLPSPTSAEHPEVGQSFPTKEIE